MTAVTNVTNYVIGLFKVLQLLPDVQLIKNDLYK